MTSSSTFAKRANAISCEKAQVEATLFVFRNPRNSNWTALIASRVKRRLISAEGEVQLNPKTASTPQTRQHPQPWPKPHATPRPRGADLRTARKSAPRVKSRLGTIPTRLSSAMPQSRAGTSASRDERSSLPARTARLHPIRHQQRHQGDGQQYNQRNHCDVCKGDHTICVRSSTW